jgi:prefoldin beta subunit
MASEQEKQLLGQAQLYQQQLQSIMTQKNALNIQIADIKKALEELEKTGESDIYKISGPILVKTKKSDAKNELDEKLEIMNSRIKTLEAGEKKAKAKIEEIRNKITKGGAIAE